MDVEAVYIQYRRFVFLVCLKILKNEADAEDATHDTFIVALNKLESLAPTVGQPKHLTTWLYRTATFKSLRILQKRQRHILVGIVPDSATPFNFGWKPKQQKTECHSKDDAIKFVAYICRKLIDQFA